MAGQTRDHDLIVNLSDFKAFLKITNTTNDSLLTMLLRSVSDFIQGVLISVDNSDGGYCNRRFKATTYTTANYSGDSTVNLLLRQYPINSIATIVIDETTTFPDGTNTLADLGFYIDEEIAGNIIYTNGWACGDPHNIQITYNAGYGDVPVDLQLAAMQLGSLQWNLKGKEGYKSEKIGEYSYTLSDLSTNLPFGNSTIQQVLDKYTRPAL